MKMRRHLAGRSRDRGQRGYMLIVLMLMVTLMIIGMLAAAPALKQQIQRDREEELIHRGTQYAVAIKRFYKKFGRYPVRIEELENTNNIRFLRRRYKDPMTPSGKWKLIHYGETNTQASGLFGAPVGGGPGGTPTPLVSPMMGGSGAPGGPAGATAGASGGFSLGGGFSLSLPSPSSSPAAGPQAGSATPAPQGGDQSAQSSTQSSPGSTSSGNNPTSPGTPVSQMGTLQPGGATLGGGPIVGVASSSDKAGIKELKGKTHYNDWQFVYDPTMDMGGQGGGVMATQGQQTPNLNPLGQPQQPGSGFGQQPGSMQPGPMQGPQTPQMPTAPSTQPQ